VAEQLLNITEVKYHLNMDDDDVMKLVREGKLNAFKIGGAYLRFERDQIMKLKARLELAQREKDKRYGVWSRIQDFCKFYGVYIISVGIILFVLYYFLIK